MTKEIALDGKTPLSSKDIAHLFTSVAAKKAFKNLTTLQTEGWTGEEVQKDHFYSVSSGIQLIKAAPTLSGDAPEPKKLFYWGTRSWSFNRAVCAEWRALVEQAQRDDMVVLTNYGSADYKAYVYDQKKERFKPASEKVLELISGKIPSWLRLPKK